MPDENVGAETGSEETRQDSPPAENAQPESLAGDQQDAQESNTQEGSGDAEKQTPFHEHKRWKEKVAENKRLTEEIAELQQKYEEAVRSQQAGLQPQGQQTGPQSGQQQQPPRESKYSEYFKDAQYQFKQNYDNLQDFYLDLRDQMLDDFTKYIGQRSEKLEQSQKEIQEELDADVKAIDKEFGEDEEGKQRFYDFAIAANEKGVSSSLLDLYELYKIQGGNTTDSQPNEKDTTNRKISVGQSGKAPSGGGFKYDPSRHRGMSITELAQQAIDNS